MRKYPGSQRLLNILESDEFLELDKRLLKSIAWIVSSSAAMGKTGFVRLSEQKGIKVSKIF